MIEEKVKDILKKYRNLEQKKDWKNQKLLGNDLKFSARDLINVYVELEKEFDIHFKEKDIVAGKFDTFDDIIKLKNKRKRTCINHLFIVSKLQKNIMYMM